MEIVIEAIEIFALLTGVVYVVLEVLQKNAMWYFGIAQGLCCAFSFGVQHLYASMGLNIYYVCISVWGIYQWWLASQLLKKHKEKPEAASATVHLRRLTPKILLISVALFVVGSAVVTWILQLIGDSRPLFDAVTAVMSAVCTWWLARSHKQQWLVWIVADILSTALCFVSGMYWMALLYIAYTVASVIGYFHWTKRGVYVD